MSLPEGYKQIEYVESNGTGSYFRTGILPTADTRVVFDGYVISGDTALYGSRYAAGNNRYAVQYIGTNQYRLSYDTTESLVPASYTKGTRYTFDQRNNELYIDDELVASVTASPTYPNAREIYAVGALNTNNAATNLGVVRMYSMQIYQGGVQVGDFLPVQDADGNIGIYNLVTDTFFPNAGSGMVSGGDIVAKVIGIEITELPDRMEYSCGEGLDLTGMVVTATYEDGITGEINNYAITGFNTNIPGEQVITVSYNGHTATFSVIINNIIVGITVTPPIKLRYVDGEELDTTGMAVYSVWSDGSTQNVADYTIDDINFTAGENTVTVRYGGFETDFEIIVGQYTVIFVDWDDSIIESQKVWYGLDAVPPGSPMRDGYVFFKWDTVFRYVRSDLTVKAIYIETNWSDIMDYINTEKGMSSVPTSSTEIKIGTVPFSFHHMGSDHFGEAITLKSSGTGYVMLGGNKFLILFGSNDLRNHVSEVRCQSGILKNGHRFYKIRTYGFILSNFHYKYEAFFFDNDDVFIHVINTPSTNDYAYIKKVGVCVTESTFVGTREADEGAHSFYLKNSESTDYAYRAGEYYSFPLKHTTIFFDWDNTFISSQSVMHGKYATAPDSPVHDGYFFLGWDKDFSAIIEDTTITALYDPVSSVVLEPESISLNTSKSITIVVTLLPDTLTQKELEWSVSDTGVVEVDPETGIIKALKPGTAMVTVTHVSQQVSASCVVTVIDTVQSIEITALPSKLEYLVGEPMDLAGIGVTVAWESGKREQVTDYVVTGFDSNSLGKKTIIIEYEGITATFQIEVINDKIVSIEITQQPDVTVYLIGRELDLTGMVVIGTWMSGVTSEVEDYSVSGYDPYQVGEQIVTVGIGGAVDAFGVLVRGVDGIELARKPNKTQYFLGEKFDGDGMKVVAHCTDGTYMYCTDYIDIEFHSVGISEFPVALGHFMEYTVEIPVQINKAYVGDPTKEDVVLTYDFATDSCTIDGSGASGSISGQLGDYSDKVKKISIAGISSTPTGYLNSFMALEEVSITAPIEELLSATMMDCTKLKSVELPDGLKAIGYSCFYGCSSLTEIQLPDSVEQIYNAVFYMSGLQKISLPASLKSLSTGAFQGCKDLQDITLNDGLEEVGHAAFEGCEKLRILIFPDSVTEINSSIYDLNTLDYVKYPAGMTTIGAPRGTNAKVIVIPEGVTDITSGAFSGFSRIENVYLPNTLKIIESNGFAGCSSLKSISIPEGVETVWHGAFQGSGLEEIYFYGRNTVVSYDAYIPEGTVIHGYRGSSAEAYCKQFGNIFVPFDDYEFTDEIKNLYDRDSIRKRVVVHFPSGETKDIENDRIYYENMSLTESICDETNLTFGGCNASKFEIQVADVDEDIRGLEIEVKQYIEDKYVPLFMGVIDSAERQDNRRFKKIIAYDHMYTVGTQDVTDWLRTLKFPISIMELRNKICEKLGFIQTSTALVNDYITISKLSIKDGVTARDVLRAICEINGVFGCITRMGYFDYISLKTTEQPFSVSGYRKVRYEEYTVRGIESLSVRGSNGATILTIGTGNRYVLRDNFLVYGIVGDALQEAAKNLLQKIKGITYRDFSGDGRGLPYIFLGRHIQYTVNANSVGKSEVVDSYVLKRTLSGVQALKDTYSASGEEFRPDVPADTTTAEAARQLEDYVTLDDFDAELSTKFDEFLQGEQYQIDIEQAVQNVLQNGGYFKIISVPNLPSSPASDTVYLIQGEVAIS